MAEGMSISLYSRWMAYLKWKSKEEENQRKDAERKAKSRRR